MADKPTSIPSVNVNDMVSGAGELSERMGISLKTFEALAQEGVMTRIGPGRYLVFQSWRNYTDRLRRAASGREGETGKDKARLLASRARVSEMKEAQLKGAVVYKDEVTHTWNNAMRQLNAILASLPSRVASRMPNVSRSDVAQLDVEVRAIRTELASGEWYREDPNYVPVDQRKPDDEPVD